MTDEVNVHPPSGTTLPLLVPGTDLIALCLWPLEPPPGLQLAAEALSRELHPGIPVPLGLALSNAPFGMVPMVVVELVGQEPVRGVYVAAKVVVQQGRLALLK